MFLFGYIQPVGRELPEQMRDIAKIFIPLSKFSQQWSARNTTTSARGKRESSGYCTGW